MLMSLVLAGRVKESIHKEPFTENGVVKTPAHCRTTLLLVGDDIAETVNVKLDPDAIGTVPPGANVTVQCAAKVKQTEFGAVFRLDSKLPGKVVKTDAEQSRRREAA